MLRRARARIDVAERPDGRHTTVWPSALEPVDWRVPGDPSQAAFFLVAAVLAERGEVRVVDVDVTDERVGFCGVLERMGGHVAATSVRGDVGDLVATASSLRATDVDASEVPSLDEVPVLAVAAAAAEGTTTFADVAELRVKESDRLAASVALVRALGAGAAVEGDALVVEGIGAAGRFARLEFDAAGDHRMAMAAAVAATVGQGGVVAGFGGVATSYPGFLAALASIR
jgi:3-phosphoshikimate 1-carboxyvinyltransferase